MSKYFEVRWHGRGGQGTVTGAKSLAEAVQGTGKFVCAFPEYGPERRGAPVRAFDRFSDERIRIHLPVHEPDVVMIVDTTLIDLVTLGKRSELAEQRPALGSQLLPHLAARLKLGTQPLALVNVELKRLRDPLGETIRELRRALALSDILGA